MCVALQDSLCLGGIAALGQIKLSPHKLVPTVDSGPAIASHANHCNTP